MQLALIGLGKLGLPLACLHAQHHRVFGIDTNRWAVRNINDKIAPITELGIEPLLTEVVDSGQFTAHSDYSVVTGTDMSLIIVPTPSISDGSFTSKYVLDAIEQIGMAIRDQQKRHVVVVSSTVMPGECDGIIRATLETASQKVVGEEVGLVYSPEFIALGSVISDMRNPAVILVGESDELSGNTYMSVANQVTINHPPIRTMSLTSAEIAKIALNSYITMKISFANALGEICERYVDADAGIVTDALGCDPRVGSKYICPGGPYGGPCFPRDNRAFAVVGKRVGVNLPLPQATDEVNERQVDRVVRYIENTGRKRVGIIGVTYKLGTPVVEEAFGLKLAQELRRRDFEVTIFEPQHIPNRFEVLPEPVKWSHDVTTVFGDDTVTVLALPDRDIAKRLSDVFAGERKRHSIVIDCWDCIPPGPWDETHIIRPGKWYNAY